MADKRITELTEKQAVESGDFLIVDNATGGTKKMTPANLMSSNKSSDTAFALIGTSEGSALAHTIYGMSVQDGTPTPSAPVEIQSAKANFKCVGKNLIPYPYSGITSKGTLETHGVTYTDRGDGSILANGTNDNTFNSWLFLANKMPLPKGYNVLRQKLVATGDASTGMMIEVYDANDTSLGNKFCNAGLDYADFTIPSGAEKLTVQLYVAKGYSVSNVVCYPMLAFSNVPNMNFEPYHATQVSTDLTLRAIEVTSSDAYNLVKDNKYYIADTLDWSEERGYQITRRIGTQTLDGNSNFTALSSNRVAYVISNLKRQATGTDLAYVISNRYVRTDRSAQQNGTITAYSNADTSASESAVLIRDDTNATSVNNYETWLSSNNVVIDYVLATPYTEHITAEQAMEILSLKTYDTATSIDGTGDVAPVIELHYAKNEISAKALTGHNEGFKAQELNNLYGVKNLLRYPYYETTKVVSGITYTDNGDGTLTISGTATTQNYFVLIQRENNPIYLNKGHYILSGINAPWWVNVNTPDNVTIATNSGKQVDSIEFSIEESGYYGISTAISNGTAITTPVTVKPMLRLASIQSDEYQPYAMSNRELTLKVQELEALIEAMS